jgi:hypothetical protein
MNDTFRPHTETIATIFRSLNLWLEVLNEGNGARTKLVTERRKFMERFRFTIVAASALALAGTLAIGQAQATVQGGAATIRAAAETGAVTEQVQFRWSGRDYCWADDGWSGPGWYWCGYAYRTGFGWGGPLGWNSWRRVDRDDFRERGEFREHREFRDRDDRFRRDRDDRGRDRDDRGRDRDDRRRY